jgi:hypothetical protein
MPRRVPDDGAPFDPATWIRQAIAAGLDPAARCFGSRCLVTRECGIDRGREPRRQLSDREREVVIDALILAGRWVGGWPWCGSPGCFGPPLAGPGVYMERA